MNELAYGVSELLIKVKNCLVSVLGTKLETVGDGPHDLDGLDRCANYAGNVAHNLWHHVQHGPIIKDGINL